MTDTAIATDPRTVEVDWASDVMIAMQMLIIDDECVLPDEVTKIFMILLSDAPRELTEARGDERDYLAAKMFVLHMLTKISD